VYPKRVTKNIKEEERVVDEGMSERSHQQQTGSSRVFEMEFLNGNSEIFYVTSHNEQP